jgi:predicted metal-dependent HD superfamily phosphohydrolase
MNILQASWQRICVGLCLNGSHELIRDRLISCYQEPQRHYHSLQHLAECIAILNDLPIPMRLDAAAHVEIEMALWFHDAIYDVKASDNEQKSANWAQTQLIEAGATLDAAKRIHDLIMATKHDAIPLLPNEQILVDVDLSILGAVPSRFVQYDKQVREEYVWVPEDVFRTKRAAILQQFLSRPFIYCTQYFRETREAQARENLQLAVTQLQNGV